MSYATPALFIRKFGLAEAVQLLQDEEALLTKQLLLDALAGAWTGSPTAEEQAAATEAVVRMTRQITTTSNLMDGYLASAVQLPLAPDDAAASVLEDCCLALVRCELADDSDNATERMDDCCKTWRTWLRDVATGKAKVAGAGGQALTGSGGARTGQATSAFNWKAFNSVHGGRP